MTLRATGQVLGALGVCATIAVCTLYVTKSTAQSGKEGQPQAESNASPIYGVTIPAGYRDWPLISVKQLTGNKLKQLRAQLGNDIAITAFREVPGPRNHCRAPLECRLTSGSLRAHHMQLRAHLLTHTFVAL